LAAQVITWLGSPSSPQTHAEARTAIVEAFRAEFGREPTQSEAQFAQGIACVETGGVYDATSYRNVVTGERITGTHNMGAIHCRALPPCPADCFEATDTKADRTEYQACFARYESAAAGFRALVRRVYGGRDGSSVLAAASSGSPSSFASALKATGYFALPVDEYERLLSGCLQRIARALGESAPIERGFTLRGLLPPLLLVGAGAALFWGTLKTPARRAVCQLSRSTR
jgi:hypothetical protein